MSYDLLWLVLKNVGKKIKKTYQAAHRKNVWEQMHIKQAGQDDGNNPNPDLRINRSVSSGMYFSKYWRQ